MIVFFAKHTAGRSWTVDRALYVKVRKLLPASSRSRHASQEAREKGVAAVDLTDRAKLLAFLKSEVEEREAKRPRVTAPTGYTLNDGLLDMPNGGLLLGCRTLSDRNSILLSKTKVCCVRLLRRLVSLATLPDIRPRFGTTAVRSERSADQTAGQ